MLGYQLKWQTIAIAGGEPLIIRSLLDNQQFSDDLGLAEAVGISSAAWPLFGLLWPSSHVLATYMTQRDLAGLRILEIGCGLGLASLVAHRLGADVHASDAHPLAQLFLDENTLLNSLTKINYHEGCWRETYADLGRFDLIIGSDILYERDEKGVLAGFIERHSQPLCEVLIVDPNRSNRSPFNKYMMSLGFERTEKNADCVLEDGSEYRGRFLAFKR